MKFDNEKLNKAINLAKNLAKDFDVEEAKKFIQNYKDTKWYQTFKLLLDMITDKEYKIDKKTYLTIAGALAYVILPLDVIPDFIPGVGFIDDVAVLGWVIKSLKEEIERYKEFRNIVDVELVN